MHFLLLVICVFVDVGVVTLAIIAIVAMRVVLRFRVGAFVFVIFVIVARVVFVVLLLF